MHHSESQNTAEGEPSDLTFWYVMSESRLLGPFLLNRLRQMALQGKLTRHDKVRRGITGEWVPAESVESIVFPDAAVLNSLAEPETDKDETPDNQASQPSTLASFASSIRGRIEVFYCGLRQEVADRSSAIRVVASWISLIFVVCFLIVVFAKQLPLDWLTTSDPFVKYSTIWDELKSKRQANATSAEWDTFAATKARELKPIISFLERTASTDNRVSQQLLWAGRDYLLKMLDDARSDESASEKKFAEHLQRATWLKQGMDINGLKSYQGNSADLIGFSAEIATRVFLVVFVVVDIWIAVWLLQHWRGAKRTP